MRSLVASVLIALIVVVSVVNGSARVKRQQACRIRNGGCEQGCRIVRRRSQCHCENGYVLNRDKKNCSDLDECKSGICQQICTNTIGSFKCSCRGGSVLLPDGRSCEGKETSCAENNGECQQVCLEATSGATSGPSSCSCCRGYELGPDERSCLDLDECASGRNDCDHATHDCVNTGGSYNCTARVVFPACGGANNGGCEQSCVREGRRIRCNCERDFELQADGKSCLRIEARDPCAQNKGGCDQICANNNGVADCKCRPGFMLKNQKCRGRCGTNDSKSLRERVTGGRPAGINSWPWMAALLDTETSLLFCGGTLITLRYILTAAHCVHTRPKIGVTVRLGEYDLSKRNETKHADTQVEELIIHERFDAKKDLLNDIAILRITAFDVLNLHVWPVCLPSADNQFEEKTGYITGWGAVQFGGPVSQKLLEAVVPVWNQSACVKAFPESIIADTMMCAGVREGGKDSCQGDSGGPFLVITEPRHVWRLAGIISWGIKCGAPNRPGIYTRVNRYLRWIYQNTDI